MLDGHSVSTKDQERRRIRARVVARENGLHSRIVVPDPYCGSGDSASRRVTNDSGDRGAVSPLGEQFRSRQGEDNNKQRANPANLHVNPPSASRKPVRRELAATRAPFLQTLTSSAIGLTICSFGSSVKKKINVLALAAVV
jgi:hypothetical protein